jgi:hypothetical protein
MGKPGLFEYLNMSIIVGFSSCVTSIYRVSAEAVENSAEGLNKFLL